MKSYKNCKVLLEKFIREFRKKTIKKNIFTNHFYENKYYDQVMEIIKGQRVVFIFDVEDLSTPPYSELQDLIFFNTQRFLKLLSSTLLIFSREHLNNLTEKNAIAPMKKSSFTKSLGNFSGKILNIYNFQIILVPPKRFPIEALESINASLIGKFTLIQGTCLSFSSKITELKIASYFCKYCGSSVSLQITDSIFKPILYCFSKNCEKKHNQKLLFDINLSSFETYQMIKISSEEDGYSLNNPFGEIDVQLYPKLKSTFLPGNKIRCAGTVMPRAYEPTISINACIDFFFKALFIEKCDFDYDQISFSYKQKYIADLLKSPNLYDHISESLLPDFLWDSDIKKALTLAFVNSRPCLSTKHLKINRQIHILLVGDFNIGKSSFLRILSKNYPGAKYTTSFKFFLNNFSSHNLEFPEYSYSNYEPRTIISPYQLLFIDASFFLKEHEFFLLNDVLEKQTTNEKGSQLIPTIIVSTSKLEDHEKNRVHTNKNQFQINLLKKFDLVFFQGQKSLEESNKKISEYLLNNYGKKKTSPIKSLINKNILKAFFKESEHVYTKFTKASIELVIYHYVLLKTNNIEKFKNKLDIKPLFSMIRLSMALSKLNFKNFISKDDVKEASRLVTFSIMSINSLKLSDIKIQAISNENKIYNLIRKISITLKKPILQLSYLSKLSSSMGFSKESFAKCLEMYENLNIWAISLKQMKLVFLF